VGKRLQATSRKLQVNTGLKAERLKQKAENSCKP